MTGVSAPREEGFSKDADKLIRRLALVALLLSRNGRPVSVAEIRDRVEGYRPMTPDAFKRRFYEDRYELGQLGIGIVANDDPDRDGEFYSLPASAYYLPPVQLSREEFLALAASLAVLQDRFAYSKPLRLALVSLAQGRPELLADATTPPMAVLPDRASAGPSVLPKLQAAVADRKTVVFRYYAIARDEELERTVDPYGLQLVGDEWYLVGRCHLREAVRTFRLSRIRSRIKHATRAPHDFSIPEGFDLAAYRDRAPWQLGGTIGEARVAVDEAMAWWVEAHYARAGTLEPGEDDGIVLTTPYASVDQLIAWVLGLGEHATLLEPAELRDQLVARLRRLDGMLDAPPPPGTSEPRAGTATPNAGAAASSAAGAVKPAASRRAGTPAGDDDWRVEVDHFTRLAALATYLLSHCGRDGEAVVAVKRVCADLALTPAQLRDDVRLLNLVTFGGDGSLLFAEYAGPDRLEVWCDLAGDAFEKPSRLSPLQADTLLLAVELVGGQLPAGQGAALATAAEKLRRARHAAPPQVAAAELLPVADEILDAVNTAIRQRWVLSIEYWSEGTDETSSRDVEPYLLVRSRSEWYYVCYCRRARARRVFRVATTKRAELLDETFTPRPDIELDLYRREGVPPTEAYAPASASVWYSPAVRRYVEEAQPVDVLPDGSCVATQAYVDEPWLTHYLLRYGGEARPLAPPEAIAALRAAVAALLDRYGD